MQKSLRFISFWSLPQSQVIVVWVGTNNHENTAEEVAGGIEAIVRLINTRQPQAKIIVLVCKSTTFGAFAYFCNLFFLIWWKGSIIRTTKVCLFVYVF